MAIDKKYYEFPECMHVLSVALHLEGVDPSTVIISMPHDSWFALWCSLDRKMRGLMTYDGRGGMPRSFRYMGMTFKSEINQPSSKAA